MAKLSTVLVTGASRGIGREIARQFALAGYRVAIHYNKHADEANDLREQLTAQGCEAMTVRADISDSAQVSAMVDAVEARFGGVDVLVNNAGVAQQKLFDSISDIEWRHIFAVNVDGCFYCCRRVLPHMIRQKGGVIINISSVWGITGASCEVAYSASKAAVIGLSRALAKEVGPSGIRVNCVAPGVIDTDMNSGLDEQTIAELKAQTPLGTIGSAADIAATVLFLASPAAKFITGQVISPNGGLVI